MPGTDAQLVDEGRHQVVMRVVANHGPVQRHEVIYTCATQQQPMPSAIGMPRVAHSAEMQPAHSSGGHAQCPGVGVVQPTLTGGTSWAPPKPEAQHALGAQPPVAAAHIGMQQCAVPGSVEVAGQAYGWQAVQAAPQQIQMADGRREQRPYLGCQHAGG